MCPPWFPVAVQKSWEVSKDQLCLLFVDVSKPGLDNYTGVNGFDYQIFLIALLTPRVALKRSTLVL